MLTIRFCTRLGWRGLITLKVIFGFTTSSSRFKACQGFTATRLRRLDCWRWSFFSSTSRRVSCLSGWWFGIKQFDSVSDSRLAAWCPASRSNCGGYGWFTRSRWPGRVVSASALAALPGFLVSKLGFQPFGQGNGSGNSGPCQWCFPDANYTASRCQAAIWRGLAASTVATTGVASGATVSAPHHVVLNPALPHWGWEVVQGEVGICNGQIDFDRDWVKPLQAEYKFVKQKFGFFVQGTNVGMSFVKP